MVAGRPRPRSSPAGAGPHPGPARRLVLQWHITDRCNLGCAHCYQGPQCAPEAPLDDLLRVLDGFADLLGSLQGRCRNRLVQGHVNVTGGEPLVREDLWDLLGVIRRRRPPMSFGVLTNGTLIDDATARRLAALGPEFVQVSLDGLRRTHDSIRGRGSFDRTVQGARCLVGAGVPVVVSFTANGRNYTQFGGVARVARRLGASRVWADRMVPCGRGAGMGDGPLTAGQTRRFVSIMRAARASVARGRRRGTEVSMRRALQFLEAGGAPYRCAAGEGLITIMPSGDLYPCRRMPLLVGNVLRTPLTELYSGSELLASLRDRERVSGGCEGCPYQALCGGGLRCLALAVTGDPFRADPGCWLATRGDRPEPYDLPRRTRVVEGVSD